VEWWKVYVGVSWGVMVRSSVSGITCSLYSFVRSGLIDTSLSPCLRYAALHSFIRGVSRRIRQWFSPSFCTRVGL